jgi:glutathione S-transferase
MKGDAVLTLWDNPFSPFTRKVRMVMDLKGIAYRSVDGLALDHLAALRALNPRAEVPVLVDGDVTVVESAEIVAYLEDVWPEPPVFPESPRLRAKARHWQRLADRVLDAVLHDISLWAWPTHRRRDAPPAGLLEAGHRTLEAFLDQFDAALGDGDYVCGTLSIADLAVFPHVPSFRLVGLPIEAARHPRVVAWDRRMRRLDVVRKDLDVVRRAAAEKFGANASPYEGEKVVWRGDRIEWLVASGFDAFWQAERAAGRAVVPKSLP